MRGYRILDNRIVLFTAVPFDGKKHGQYKEHFEHSFYTANTFVKKVVGVLWYLHLIKARTA